MWKHCLAVALSMLFLGMRFSELFTAGNFIGEDGWVFFAGAYNHPFPASLFVPYAGYFHLFPRLVAEAAMIVGFEWQPYVYAFVSSLFVSLALTFFYTPTFRCWIHSDLKRLGVVLICLLAHNAENMCLVLGLHWYLTFALLLACSVKLPSSRAGRVGLYLLGFFAAWSSPSVFAGVPVLAYRVIRPFDSIHRKWSLFVLLNCFVVFVFVWWMRLKTPTRTADFSFMELWLAVKNMSIRGWFAGTFVGEGFSNYLGRISPHLLDTVGVILVVGFLGLLAISFKNHQMSGSSLRSLVVLTVCAAILLALSFARSLYIPETAASLLPRHTRYLTAPTLLLTVVFWAIVWNAAELLPKSWRLAAPLFLWILQVSLLLATIGEVKHWSRAFEWFPWSEQVSAVQGFYEESLVDGAEPDTLYVPSDVPYWGPVLIKNGGYQHRVEQGFRTLRDLNKREQSDDEWQCWFGRFNTDDRRYPWMEHEQLGQVEYRGIAEGRVWFRDKRGVLYFSSHLLYPHFWSVDGMEFTLLESELLAK